MQEENSSIFLMRKHLLLKYTVFSLGNPSGHHLDLAVVWKWKISHSLIVELIDFLHVSKDNVFFVYNTRWDLLNSTCHFP